MQKHARRSAAAPHRRRHGGWRPCGSYSARRCDTIARSYTVNVADELDDTPSARAFPQQRERDWVASEGAQAEGDVDSREGVKRGVKEGRIHRQQLSTGGRMRTQQGHDRRRRQRSRCDDGRRFYAWCGARRALYGVRTSGVPTNSADALATQSSGLCNNGGGAGGGGQRCVLVQAEGRRVLVRILIENKRTRRGAAKQRQSNSRTEADAL